MQKPNLSPVLSSIARPSCFAGLFLVFSLALLSNAFAAPSNEDISNQIGELSKKIDTLTGSLNSRMDKLEKSISNSKKDPDAEAKVAFREIHGLVGANKFTEAKTKLDSFMKEHSGSSLVTHAARLKSELDVVGKKAPSEWKIEKWLQGEDKVDLKGKKPTLIVFWEIWCPHCRREVPRIQQLHEKFSPNGFQIIALTKMSRGKTEDEIVTFLKEQKVSYPAAKESGELSSYFAVSGIPASVVLKDGKVVWRGHPARITEDMIKGWI